MKLTHLTVILIKLKINYKSFGIFEIILILELLSNSFYSIGSFL